MMCKDVTIELDASGDDVTINPDDVNDGISDPCGILSIELSQSVFGCADLGMTTIKVTASDPSGNESKCDVKVTVFDPIPPVFTYLPPDLTVFCAEPGPGDPAIATDNCAGVLTYLYSETYEVLPNGPEGAYVVIRTWVASDHAGNNIFHTQYITVLPGGNVIMNCSPDIVTPPAQAPVQVTWDTPTILEVCVGEAEMVQIEGNPSGSYFNPGTTSRITYEYVDVHGIRHQCAFNITVPSNASDYIVVINQDVTCDELIVRRCVVTDLPEPNNFSFEWVPNGPNPPPPTIFQLNSPGLLEVYADGSASLTGSWISVAGTEGWDGTIWFFHRRTFDGWEAIGGVANNVSMLGNPATWDYFELDESRSQLLGTGGNTGMELNLHIPADYPGFGFQVGNGANTKTMGQGGWFTAATVPQGGQNSNGQAFFSFMTTNCQNVELIKQGAEVISLDGFDYPVQWSNGVNGYLLGDVAAGDYSVSVTTQSGQQNVHSFRLVKPDNCINYWEDACREENVAVGANAKQSSTYQNAVATRAVDGNTDGDFNNGSVASTLAGGQNYWETRLDKSYMIESIRIWPRTDCCSERLDPFYVFVSPNPFPLGIELEDILADTSILVIYHEGPMDGSWLTNIQHGGQYVRVQVVSGDRLELAEVEVLVCQPDRLIPGSSFTSNEAETQKPVMPQFELLPGLSSWPNPAGNDLNLGILLEETEDVLLVVMSSTGQQMFLKDLGAVKEHRLRIDVAGWAPGMYFVTAYTDKGATSKPIMIQR
jgi:hypothetical protein